MIIAISGSNGVGKDLVGKIIKDLLPAFEIKKFASTVNDCYKLITGVDFHSLNRENKERHRSKFIEFAEIQKKIFGEDVWVKNLFIDYVKKLPLWIFFEKTTDDITFKKEHPCWVITDLRFQVEYDAVRERKGVFINIGSEKPPFEVDYNLKNDGTIEDLKEEVKKVLIKEKLIK